MKVYAKIIPRFIMQILMLCYEYPPLGGGGGKVAAGLSAELVRQGHQVTLLTMGYRGIPAVRMVEGVRVIGVPCLRLRKEICSPAELSTYLISARLSAFRWIQQIQFDLIHAHFIFPDGAIAYWLKKKTGLPYLITAHGSDVPGYNPHRFQLEHLLLKPFWRRVVEGAEAIVTASAHLEGLIRQQLPQQKVERIFNAISPPDFRPQAKDPLRIVVISRLLERKGIQYLLQALDGCEVPYQVDIIGAGPYQTALEKLAKQIRSAAVVTFHGWLSQDDAQFWRFLETAAIFVFPSAAENFPMVLLEAMSARLAIITTNDSGCAEVVGDAAILIPPQNAEAIRQALKQLREHPALLKEYGERAFQRLRTEFTWEAAAGKYSALYRSLYHKTSKA